MGGPHDAEFSGYFSLGGCMPTAQDMRDEIDASEILLSRSTSL